MGGKSEVVYPSQETDLCHLPMMLLLRIIFLRCSRVTFYLSGGLNKVYLVSLSFVPDSLRSHGL